MTRTTLIGVVVWSVALLVCLVWFRLLVDVVGLVVGVL